MAVSNVELIVNAAKAINPLRKVQQETKKVEEAVRDANGRLRDAKGRFVAVGNSAQKSSKQIGGFTRSLKGLIAAAAVIQTTKFVLFKTAELETQTRSLKVLTGSLENAQKIIQELQAFGAVTPFTSAELIETAKRLKAFGFETEKIVDVTKRLSDVAGATGADLAGIATAFGQIQAKGRLQGEELLQLQERGVDLQGTLRKEYGLTAEEFQKALSKGQIGADAVNFALEKLTETGGKYADGAIAQSDTLAGKFSTIQDGIGRLATTVGTTLEPAIKFVLDLAIQAVNEITTLLGKGAEARNFGLNQKQLDEIDRKARETAEQIGKARGYGFLDPRTALLQAQIGRDMLRQYGFESGQLQLPTEAAAGTAPQRPELGGGTGGGAGGGAGGGGKERVDMSQKMLEINQRLRAEQEAGNETLLATLELMQRRQEIAESNLQPIERQNELEQAGSDFRQKVLGIEDKIARDREKNAADAYKAFQDQIKQQEDLAQAMREADPMFQMKQRLEELLDVQNQVAAGATAIGNAFSNSFKSVINGSKSAEQALADMMASVAEHFLDMAAQIIAQQLAMILYGTIMKALGISGAFGSGASAPSIGTDTNYFGGGFTPMDFFAEGGFVNKPTSALIGEGGEPEYVIPQSKMQESMARFSAGARGSSVIPANGGGGGDYGGAMGGGGTVVNYNGPTLNFNSEDYVPASAVPGIIDEAAKRGAKAGESRTFASLQNSRSRRSRIGLGQ